MSEAMARALGADGALTVEIGGKQCTVRPLGIKELTEVERDCLARYKRQFLSTFAENLDLLPEDKRDSMLERKMEEVAKWDVDDLPRKFAHDPDRIKLTPQLRAWLGANMDFPAGDDKRARRVVAAVLDQGMLEPNEYVKLAGGAVVPRVKVPYVNWWITGCYEGMISFVWVCFKHHGVTREQVTEALQGNMPLLVDLAREIERLSAPQVGNG